MPVTIGALSESAPGETRVSIVPEIADKFAAAGARVLIERGAGVSAQFPDRAVQESRHGPTAAAAVLAQADVLFTVQPPSVAQIEALRPGTRGDRLHAGARHAARRSRRCVTRPRHQLRDGTGAAHLARAVDGRVVLAGRGRRLQGGADRRRHARSLPADADHRRRHHSAGAGAGRRRRRRRPAGHRHRQAPRRGGRGLRRAQRHARAGASRSARSSSTPACRRRARAATRASSPTRRRPEQQDVLEARIAVADARHHHRRDSRAPRAAHHLARRGRAHESRRGDRRYRRPSRAATAN